MPLEVKESFTIKQVKEKIEKEHNKPADSMKLVGYGKTLQDSKSLKDYDIKEGDFLVAMVSNKNEYSYWPR